MTRFYTDGTNLYELVAEQAHRNYGLMGGWLRRTIIRDVVSENTATLDDLNLAALSEITVGGSTVG